MKYSLFFICVFSSALLSAQSSIRIDTKGSGNTINRNIYGHFAEHLGNCIYGGLYVGENNSRIPNRQGVRLDIIDALKKLKVPVLRWPGGCFADTYHWQDGIGPKKDRPSLLNIWWGNVKEDNSFGTHEFLDLCEWLGAEPYLSGNVGSGTVQELADWVKYTTHPNGSSPMPELRARNGRDKPWQVRYWGLGNEAWGCGGNMTAAYYANVYRQYATFFSNGNEDYRLYRIASGASDGDYHWTEELMKSLPSGLYDALALHHYSVINWSKKGPAASFTEQEYFITLQRALEMEELVTRHSAIMDKYDPQKKKALVVDEWGGWYDSEPGTNSAFLFQQNTMRDAMIAGVNLNIFNNHCDRVKMANLAQVINVLQAVILTREEKMILTPTYHVMEMYNIHQDAELLPLSLQSPVYRYGKDSLPAVSASASRNQHGLTHISLVNIDAHKSQELTIHLENGNYHSVRGRILQSAHLQDHNSFEQPGKIIPRPFSGARLKDQELTITLPPFSVIVLELQ